MFFHGETSSQHYIGPSTYPTGSNALLQKKESLFKLVIYLFEVINTLDNGTSMSFPTPILIFFTVCHLIMPDECLLIIQHFIKINIVIKSHAHQYSGQFLDLSCMFFFILLLLYYHLLLLHFKINSKTFKYIKITYFN